MKKLLFVLMVTMIPFGISAQGWLNSAINRHRQNSQRIVPRNSQQTRLNQQGYERRERLEKESANNQQRIRSQQQSSIESSSNEVRSTSTETIQTNDKVVSLVANGTGSTKEEATKNALRSAIEQAFGTFVSANTAVLDDELVKDEIVTVSTGNIKTYNVLSSSQSSSGLYDVSVQAVVSIDQLTKFAQSKGMQTELAGASFVMNMKIRELNKKNEVAAIEHMIEKVMAIAQNGLFDYKLESSYQKIARS